MSFSGAAKGQAASCVGSLPRRFKGNCIPQNNPEGKQGLAPQSTETGDPSTARQSSISEEGTAVNM